MVSFVLLAGVHQRVQQDRSSLVVLRQPPLGADPNGGEQDVRCVLVRFTVTRKCPLLIEWTNKAWCIHATVLCIVTTVSRCTPEPRQSLVGLFGGGWI